MSVWLFLFGLNSITVANKGNVLGMCRPWRTGGSLPARCREEEWQGEPTVRDGVRSQLSGNKVVWRWSDVLCGVWGV